MSSARRRGAGDSLAGFRRGAGDANNTVAAAVPQGLIRAARKSGQLNLSGRELTEGEEGPGVPPPRCGGEEAATLPAGTDKACSTCHVAGFPPGALAGKEAGCNF